jgi:integrase
MEQPDEIMARVMAVMDEPPGSLTESAVLGALDVPKVKVSEALRIYMEEIVADELVGKSENQKRNWKKVKQRAVDNFIAEVGDKPVDEITREDARKIYDLWRKRIAPPTGKATHSASSGNRDVGNMRVLLSAYMKHVGVDGYKNPFDGFSFSEKTKKSRPPFSAKWIQEKILRPGALAKLNEQARGIVLALIETGCRPSEIINLKADQIVLSAPVPYIDIRPVVDSEGAREIKTASSRRQIPLVGVALEVFKKHPSGFPHYADREELFSAVATKFLRTNGLFETTEHKIYSFRHAFEDRMKVAGLDTELRMILMGHANDRPKYGKGGTLEWRRQEMMKIVLPFDSAIV